MNDMLFGGWYLKSKHYIMDMIRFMKKERQCRIKKVSLPGWLRHAKESEIYI